MSEWRKRKGGSKNATDSKKVEGSSKKDREPKIGEGSLKKDAESQKSAGGSTQESQAVAAGLAWFSIIAVFLISGVIFVLAAPLNR